MRPVAEIVVKGAFTLLCVWGVWRIWRLRAGKYSAGVRLAWLLVAVLAVGAMAALWQWDTGGSHLLALPARLLRSAGKKLSSMGRRDPDGLYQNGEFTALGEGAVPDVATGRVTFKALSHANHLDFGRAIEYRSWRLRCPDFGGEKDVDMAGTTMRVYTDVRCEILGTRPSP